MAISREVKVYIENYEAPLKKELSYVKNNDWSTENNRRKRIKKHDTNYLLVSRAINKLIHFHKIAEEDLHYKTVKSFIDIFIEFFSIYSARYERYVEVEDWTEYTNVYGDYDEDKLATEIEEEVAFQSDLLSHVNSLKIKIDKLNLEGEVRSLELPIHADIPAPFLLRHKLEFLFPEIKNYKDAQE